MAGRQACNRSRVASTLRYCMTVGGTVVLVVGTLCYAWGSEDPQPGQPTPTTEHHSPLAPGPALRSASVLCCSIGGLLLLSGLLWSIQVSTWGPAPGDQYRLSRDLYHLAGTSSGKESCRPLELAAITTGEEEAEATPCLLAGGPPAPLGQPQEEVLSCGSPGGALGTLPPSPPPSYKSIVLAVDSVTPPGAVSSCSGWVQTWGGLQAPSRPQNWPPK